MTEQTPEWIAVDWGTSKLRAWAMRGSEVLAEAQSDEGMGRLARDAFEPALVRLVEPWLGTGVTPVLACGMVGARQGWAEAPYRMVPCAPVAPLEALQVPTRDARLSVAIVPGVAQAEPADVMRGEEVQIAGYLAQDPSFDGVLLLPGTHSKRVRVQGGMIRSFSTAMTGELFELLQKASVLRHGMEGDGWDAAAFDAGVELGLAGAAFERLFALRAEALLHGLPPEAARARLSGLLIGAELRALAPNEPVVLIGASRLVALYQRALEARGQQVSVTDGAALVRCGLTVLWQEGKTTHV